MISNNIAVIMSVYKNDKLDYLKEALESLYIQSYNKFDIFIQCDGYLPSELLSFLEREFQNRRVFYLNKRDENLGLAYSLNELLIEVLKKDYTYIMRMDADDISVENRVKLQYKFMNEHENINICGGWIEEFNIDTTAKQVVSYPKNSHKILENMKKRNSVAHVTTIFRRNFFEQVGFYDTSKLNEDFDLWIRGFKFGCTFYNIQEVLVKVRTSNDFFNRRKNIKRAIEVMQLKIDVTKTFSLGYLGYIYAIAHFLLFMSPGWVKSVIYKHLRK
jgi:GT2 family glycosyltransferase